jgi:hypothetical protein
MRSGTNRRPAGLASYFERPPEVRSCQFLACLLAGAWDSPDAIEGRLEASLYEPLATRRCLQHQGSRALFHSRDSDALAATPRGESALTRLDGKSWIRHHI